MVAQGRSRHRAIGVIRYTHKPRGGREGRCHLSLALKIGEWLGTERVLRSVAEC